MAKKEKIATSDHADKGRLDPAKLGLILALILFTVAASYRYFTVKAEQTPAAIAADFHRQLAEGQQNRQENQSPGATIFTEVAHLSGLEFTHDTGATGQYHLPEEMGPGAAFVDVDNDGRLDIFLAAGGDPLGKGKRQTCRLFRNYGDRFVDETEQSGIQVEGQAFGVACADFDEDGDVDIYVTRLGTNVLLVNDGRGRFSDQTITAGVSGGGFGTSCVFFDYDRDGLLDLYVANYVNWSPALETPCYSIQGVRDYCNPVVYKKPSSDLLFRNLGDGSFEDVSNIAGIGGETGNGLAVVACDFNDDGWPDLYVANDQTPAFLWQNKGDGTFEEIALWAGCAFSADGIAIAGMGIACEDFSGDGRYDLLVTNIRDQSHLFLENEGELFVDRSATRGLAVWSGPATAFGVSVFDQDHDGSFDAYFANGDVNFTVGSYLDNPYGQMDHFARFKNGTFVDYSASSGNPAGYVSRGVTTGDYDNDGDLDLLVCNNGGPVQLLRNNRQTGNWLMVAVRTGKANRHAIGARLQLEAGGTVQMREVRPQQGYLASNDPRVHFGLGGSTRVTQLSIAWPDGSHSTYRDLAVNRHLVITQGAVQPQQEGLP